MDGNVATVSGSDFGDNNARLGLVTELGQAGAIDKENITFHGLQLTTVDSERLSYDYVQSVWSLGLVESTLNLVQNGTHTTSVTFTYTDVSESLTFSYPNIFQSQTVSTPENLVGFDVMLSGVSSSNYVSVDSEGTLTLRNNFDQRVSLVAKACPLSSSPVEFSTIPIYANLRAGFNDVDMDSQEDGRKSPYFYTGTGDLQLHIRIRPGEGMFFRSAQFTINIPINVGLGDSSFVKSTDASKYTVSYAKDTRVVLVSSDNQDLNVRGEVYIGYIHIPDGSITDNPSGIFGVTFNFIRSANNGLYGSPHEDYPSFGTVDAVAAAAGFYMGVPERRRLLDGRYDFLGPLTPIQSLHRV